MSEPQRLADLPILAARRGYAVGLLAWGTMVLALVVSTSNSRVAALITSLLGGAIYGLVMWALTRMRPVLISGLVRAPAPPEDRSRRAAARGFAQATMTAALVVVVLAVMATLVGRDGTDGTDGVLGGIVLGLSLFVALGARDLDRVQRQHGLVAFTRVGAPRFAWTRAHAVDRVVAVAAESSSEMST